MPADGVLDRELVAARAEGTHRCWVQPSGRDGDVTGTWFDVTDGERVLHEMIRRGSDAVPVGCRGGGCGVCRVRVLEGAYTTRRMSRKHVSEADEAAGVVLACRLVPLGDLVVELAPAEPDP
jgi:ferredoxin